MTQNKTELQKALEWFDDEIPMSDEMVLIFKAAQSYADLPSKINMLQHYGVDGDWFRKDDIIKLIGGADE